MTFGGHQGGQGELGGNAARAELWRLRDLRRGGDGESSRQRKWSLK